MRISSRTLQLQWLASFQRQQTELAVSQRQVSSGRRIATAADDPAGAAQATLLQQGLDRVANYGANAEVARRRLSLQEGAVSQAADVLNRLRELAIQAANASQTSETRGAIAAEADELLTSLLNIANTQDGEGRYLFAGNRVQVQPFILTGSAVSYQGDEGVRFQRIGDARLVQEGDPGSAIFLRIPSGNGAFSVAAGPGNQGTASWNTAAVAGGAPWVPDTYTLSFSAPDSWEARDGGGTVIASGSYTPGSTLSFGGINLELQGTPAAGDSFTISPSRFRSVFETAAEFVAALRAETTTPAGKAIFTSRINATLTDLDRGLEQLGNVRSQVGARLATIERQLDSNADQELDLARTLSSVRDLDYASAISRLEQQLTSLEAAQRSYARARAFSLFDFL